MSNETKHQLIPNTYTICESTEQCKELFEWARLNNVETYAECENGELILSFSVDKDLIADFIDSKESLEITYFFIPLPEFISRLQGKWQPNEVSDYQALYEAEKAKYEKLLQGVKDAKAEMDKRADVSYFATDYEKDIAKGYESAIEILTEKTGI